MSRRRFLVTGGAAAATLSLLRLPEALGQTAAPTAPGLAEGTPLPNFRWGYAVGPAVNERIQLRPIGPPGRPTIPPITLRVGANARTARRGLPAPVSDYKAGDPLIARGALDLETGEFVVLDMTTYAADLTPFSIWPGRG